MNTTGKEPVNDNEDAVDEAELAAVAEALKGAIEEAPGLEGIEDAGEPDPVELLAAENAGLKDRALRLTAEMENLRRRTEREKAEATLYAASNFARDILAVSDNMDRALDAVSEEERAAADTVMANLLQGVEMVQRELLNTFERHGIQRINPLGERFDPNKHQAMFEAPDEKHDSGIVMQVVQPGFIIGERVLRPAMVGVARNEIKPAGETTPVADQDATNGG